MGLVKPAASSFSNPKVVEAVGYLTVMVSVILNGITLTWPVSCNYYPERLFVGQRGFMSLLGQCNFF
jgi:hypothetical protein